MMRVCGKTATSLVVVGAIFFGPTVAMANTGEPQAIAVADAEPNAESPEPETALPVQTMVGAGIGSAVAATTGLAISAAVVGGIFLVFGTPREPDDVATTALVAGAFFYALPLFATPAIGAFLGATIAGVLGGRKVEDVLLDAAAAGAVGFCGSALLLLPSWWLVSIPMLITFLIFGEAVLLPAVAVASAAFVPIWGTAGGAAAAGGVYLGRQLAGTSPPEPELPLTSLRESARVSAMAF